MGCQHNQADVLSSDHIISQACQVLDVTPEAMRYPSSCASVFIDLPEDVKRCQSSKRDSTGKDVGGFRPWGVKWGSLAHPYKGKK